MLPSSDALPNASNDDRNNQGQLRNTLAAANPASRLCVV